MDMLHGSIADKLFFFAMPIGLMGLFEQLFNSADVFILGRFVGKSAMAAVGNNMPVIGILVMLLMGISLGANVTIAQYLGARRDDKVERTVQTAILMSFGLGALLAVIGELIVYPAFWVLEVPPDVYDMAEQYLRIFLLGLPFLSLYNFEAAIFRSCGDGIFFDLGINPYCKVSLVLREHFFKILTVLGTENRIGKGRVTQLNLSVRDLLHTESSIVQIYRVTNLIVPCRFFKGGFFHDLDRLCHRCFRLDRIHRCYGLPNFFQIIIGKPFVREIFRNAFRIYIVVISLVIPDCILAILGINYCETVINIFQRISFRFFDSLSFRFFLRAEVTSLSH